MTDPFVLYVDDEPANQLVLQHALAGRFRVLTTSSGAEALELMATHDVAAILTDQRMPNMDGNTLLDQVKHKYPHTVRMILTAYSDLDPILNAVNQGLVARYLVKPWRRQELEEVVAWAVGTYQRGSFDRAVQSRLLQTERLATLGTIGAAVLHDLRQPLHYMQSNLQQLQERMEAVEIIERLFASRTSGASGYERRLVQNFLGQLKDSVVHMTAGARVMADLTSHLSQFAKADAHGDDDRALPVPVIRFVLSACRDCCRAHNGELSYEGPADLPPLAIGTTAFTQVMFNLVRNGSQAVEEGSRPGGKVSVRANCMPGAVHFAVEDNGVGMPADVLAQVGTPFFSTRPHGTGLGVSQSRRLIESGGGNFSFHSVEGKGSCVEVTLPVARVEAGMAA